MRRNGGILAFSVLAYLAVTDAQSQACSPACQNGGICASVNQGSFACICAGTGYTGSTCSVPAGTPATGSGAPSSSSTCPVPCVNGDCTQQFNSDSYYCKCRSGYDGASCSVQASPPPATTTTAPSTNQSCPVSCVNGACTQLSNSETYYCKCNAGFNGTACATSTSVPPTSTPAASSPPGTTTSTNQSCPVTCLNGQCQQQFNSESSFCQCNSGWTGTSCGTQASAAAPPTTTAATQSANQSCPISCVNGRCTQQYNSESYYCLCNTGYSGDACTSKVSAPTQATSSPITTGSSASPTNQSCPVACFNGLCTQQFNSEDYFCQCKSGYSGASCNTPSTSGTGSTTAARSVCGANATPCYHGSCLQRSNGTYCQCDSGYQGSNCNQIVSAATSSSKQSGHRNHLSGAAIFGIVVAVMVGLIAIAAAAFVVWRRRRTETFVRFHDTKSYQEEVEIGKQTMSGRPVT